MIKIVLRNSTKKRGKTLYECFNKDCAKNYLNYYMFNDLKKFKKINSEYRLNDDNDFIDVEINNHIVATIYNDLKVSYAIRYLDY